MLISTAALPVPPQRGYGGIEWIVYMLAKELHKQGHDVSVAATADSVLPEGVNLIASTTVDERGFENIALVNYGPQLEDFDIIHDNSHVKLVYKVFRDYPDKYKFVSTSHDPGCVQYPIEKPNHITVSKSHQKNHFEQTGITSKVVYNTIDPEMYKFNKGARNNRYLFLSRPTSDKGPIDCIRMCQELDVPLDMVCGRVAEITQEAVISSMMCKIGSKWKWMGEVPHEKKVSLFENAKAFLFPSSWDLEPFGLVVIEALYSGCPVVTYDRGPMSELVEHGVTGFLAKNRDEFKKYMLQVDQIDPQKCHDSAIAKGFCSPERMANDYLKLYEKAIAGERW
jgi:glycosyltransferase involved in cell wall biosynthesis